MTDRVTIEALAAWLKEKDDVVVLGHVSPDGDATGSVIAITQALKNLGKRAVACLPGGMPKLYAWMPFADEVIATDDGDALPFEPKAALSVDVSEKARLGEAGVKLFDSCPDRAMLDHHGTNAGFGDVFHVDANAAASGELAARLIEALGAEIAKPIAECLFVAISTDCGQFNYSNTRADTLTAAAKCVAAGADVSMLTRTLYRTRTYGRTKLLGLVLAGLQVSEDGTVAWAKLTEAMLDEAHAISEDKEGIVNYLLEIEGVRVAVLAEQRGESTKFSLRSYAPVDVANHIAVPLGGGGHNCAAGVTLDTDVDSALEKVLDLAKSAIDAAKAAL